MKTIQEFIVNPSKAVVVTIHGAGEHIGRYRHFGEWLNNHGVSMIGGDLPGLGRSEEARGHIQDFNLYLKKVDDWIRYVKEMYPNQPVFLFGHSMGGLIVLRYLEEYPDSNLLAGVIVTSPAIRLGMKVPKWQLKFAEFMIRFWPTLRLKSGIKAEQLTHDVEIVEANKKDPLVYGKVTIQWFFEFQKAIEEVWNKVHLIPQRKIPLLFLQSGEDALVDPLAAKEFIPYLSQETTEFHFLPGLYHEVLNEVDREKYLEMISTWIKQRIT